MKNYMGVKLIKAKKMTMNEWHKLNGSEISSEQSDSEGYMVKYSDEYTSWSPKAVFESAYLELEEGTKITEKDVDNFIDEVEGTDMNTGKSTLTHVGTITGFDQYDVSSCVDPKNYDIQIGMDIGVKNIKSKLWGHLGFVLQWAKNGLKK
ncbi:MAG: Gp49 family protein [Minisyncoccia bacterium]|jgi:hypothetical protein